MSTASPPGESPARGDPVSHSDVIADAAAAPAAGAGEAQPRPRQRFLAEFQSRAVYRVGALYAVAGWAVVQASDIVLDAFEAPHWVIKSVLIATLAGFPIALLLARLLHPTPQAVREVPARRIWLFQGLGVALLGATLAVSIFVARRMLSGTLPAPTAASERVPSLAVLPLAQLLPNDDAFFAEGVQEDLITRLASIRNLHVISREALLPFRDSKKDSSEIGRDLGATYVLSGSVRRAGNDLRGFPAFEALLANPKYAAPL